MEGLGASLNSKNVIARRPPKLRFAKAKRSGADASENWASEQEYFVAAKEVCVKIKVWLIGIFPRFHSTTSRFYDIIRQTNGVES
ncbi:MAG: hypothetical protein ACYTGS_08715, partial [Planctomycetota bacterium]